MRLICESCNHGYSPKLPNCPWCNALADFAHQSTITSCLDIEVYRDYFLARFDTGECYQMFPGHELDIAGLKQTLSRYTLVTFNGINYDIPIIQIALDGRTNAQLKQASDKLIVEQTKYWELLREYNATQLDIDHIDIMNVAPGAGGLKEYGAKLHTRKLQDLPIDPSASIAWHDRVLLREYCGNDLTVTRELFNHLRSQIELREVMSAEYKLDLRSKSDAQIAEAIMRASVDARIDIPYVPEGTIHRYTPPKWIKFTTLHWLADRLANSPFTITDKGSIKMPGWLSDTVISIGAGSYRMGIGGLHSTEEKISHFANEKTLLQDWDFSSYYPSLILRTGIYPNQIGDLFVGIYNKWFHERIAAKKKGKVDKKFKTLADTYKILLNGSFGKLGSRYSAFYAPEELISVTITGQLCLLMIIEAMEAWGITVVSANTDGLILKLHSTQQWVVDMVVKWIEDITHFEMERTDYSAVHSRDVNSYIAVKTDGSIKLKGAFSTDFPSNPTGSICVTALIAYLKDKTPFEQTVKACTDITQFIYVRKVKGGGVLCRDVVLPVKTTQRFKIQTAGSIAEYDRLAAIPPKSEYLGKVVRWYYATDSHATIRYKANYNLVPRTEGCEPIMDLPDRLPADLDYAWYVAECNELLKDIGL